ncbi:MAG: hypothetical protein HN356_12035 [Calditrichaeota bacterium]|jgi:hypothetical protein|nr:hypothetical protein [Calditrichota bacterium]MBT7616956.1 hypothetical protein [Calditrichota bacterium]MBT7787585.1 hypothetical protein [Calditrichota bacterium]
MKNSLVLLLICLTAGILISSCASFRSGIEGEFAPTPDRNFGLEKVSVLFIFSHFKQSIGYDAIPKLERKNQIIRDFDDLFGDALNELSNVKRYTTFTEFSSDYGSPKRRDEKDSLMSTHDYVMRIKFSKEKSFVKHFLGNLFATASVTLLPIPFSQDYSVSLDLYNSEDILIKSYTRKASMTKWVQSFLIFIYPFHTEKRKEEEIYIAFMHDIFYQIETERVLVEE